MGVVAREVELDHGRRVVPEADRVGAAAVDARAVVEVGRLLEVADVGAHVVGAAGHLDQARGALVHGGERVIAPEGRVRAPDPLARAVAVVGRVGPEDARRAVVDLDGGAGGAGDVVDRERVGAAHAAHAAQGGRLGPRAVVVGAGDHAPRELALVVVHVGGGQVVGRVRVHAAADDDVAAAERARGDRRGGRVEVGRLRVHAAGELALREAGRVRALVLGRRGVVGRLGLHAAHDGQRADGGVLRRDALRVGGEGVEVGRVRDGAAHLVARAVVVVDVGVVVGEAAVR